MTGEEGKSGGTAGVAGGTAPNVTDNANVNVNVNVSQRNGRPEKAPVVGGTNVETLPRPGKNRATTQTQPYDIENRRANDRPVLKHQHRYH